MISEDVAVALDGQFSWLTLPATGVSGNLYIQDLPDDPDEAVAVFQYGGSTPLATNGNPVLVERPRLQILVRDPAIDVAFSRAYEIWNWLSGQTETTFNGVSYMKVIPVSSPAELGPDSANRQRVVCNYEIWKG